ncbi:MAG: collagenase-like protease [Candidatus Pacebacteria bacterium CG_4_9_14_3_um_filter_40_12]|nr:MAG: collagenase-like protease [Candidatus Pacebacteria bacterium CG10_big_fil_rev_8_21_14_0_10_40_26]PIZ79662.1 MAG: collagenase-like protease [Candidatus Pacebacteria bacterium CG_4_10_14_0_2_um_filter_40_20]PJA69167.1 MAG: collagenase-like protease [Candidatus Pacebacteria bacterium CG_4_9_14_3_um_filter_40_12]PJC41805.1 MAG: collagenase-like protease [Candidatus Pacebacteria bacterium CG_4_9_14_0_2_um_filter_40_15]
MESTGKKVPHSVELMAPVGSFESLHAAINAGADSIFFGITQLNMRARAASNFDFKDLAEIARISQEHGVRSYLTLNTLLYDHDLKLAYRIIDAVKEAGIDAIIVADMAAIVYANSVGVEVHISTQLSISNVESVRFYAQFSDMIVLARELTVPMMQNICDAIKAEDIRGRNGKPLDIEVFGHGAMCVAISGRCGMSLLTDNSSANRGACRQNCRRSYKIIDEQTKTQLKVENDYVMSPEDLCTVGLLDELVGTGITVLKLEGRGRSADYVDTVVRTYREALDSLNEGTYSPEKITEWNARLGTVYNRGLSAGFYMGKPFVEWSGAYGNKATKKRELVGTVTHYFPKIKVAEVQVQDSSFAATDEYVFTGQTTGALRGENPELIVENTQVADAQKGDVITFVVADRVRKGDRLYKIVGTA